MPVTVGYLKNWGYSNFSVSCKLSNKCTKSNTPMYGSKVFAGFVCLFNWSIVDLQVVLISAAQQSDLGIHIYTCFLICFSIVIYPRILYVVSSVLYSRTLSIQLHCHSFSSLCSQAVALLLGVPLPEMGVPCSVVSMTGAILPCYINCLDTHPWASATFRDIFSTSQAQLLLICLFPEVLPFLFSTKLYSFNIQLVKS